MNTIRVSNGLDLDQDRRSVGHDTFYRPDLGQNFLQSLLADDNHCYQGNCYISTAIVRTLTITCVPLKCTPFDCNYIVHLTNAMISAIEQESRKKNSFHISFGIHIHSDTFSKLS